jgi:WD40 repeat protein
MKREVEIRQSEYFHLMACVAASPTKAASPSAPGTTQLVFKGYSGPVISAKWSPDGKFIASTSFDNTVKLWNATSGKVLWMHALSWSHNGKYIAVTTFQAEGAGIVQVLDASSRKVVVTYKGHTDLVTDAEWSPNGTRIASVSQDKTVRIWTAT